MSQDQAGSGQCACLGGQGQSKQEPALEGSWQAWEELPGSSTTHWAREGPSVQEGTGRPVAPRAGRLGSIARHKFHRLVLPDGIKALSYLVGIIAVL